MAVFFTRRGAAATLEQYGWKKYTVNSTYSTKETTLSNRQIFTYLTADNVKIYMSSSLQLSNDGTAFFFDSNADAASYVYRGVDNYPYFSETQGSAVAYYCNQGSYGAYQTVLYATKKYERVQTQTQGSYIEDVISTNPAAYPDNGIQDGYWYVKVA